MLYIKLVIRIYLYYMVVKNPNEQFGIKGYFFVSFNYIL